MNKSCWTDRAGIFMLVFLFLTTACVPYSKLRYFNDIDEFSEPVVNPMKLVTISSFDKLRIYIMSTDEKTSAILNSKEQADAENVNGFVVDETGNISYPFVGKIQVGGLTLLEAGNAISDALSSIMTKPEVLVSLLNSKITVVGEVGAQGSFTIDKDFISIFESIALGGGLTQYADRKNVIILRNENSKLIHYTIDLTNSKITTSSLYYVLPNDIIIVEPLRTKAWSSVIATFSTVLSTLSAVLSIYYISALYR